ncbi:MAG: hypothetical protein ACI4RO_03810 [Candidatus Scatosoma sp.]
MKKFKTVGLFKEDGGFSVTVTLLFAVYNAYLGVTKRYYFALSIAAYYVILSFARILLYVAAKRERNEKLNGAGTEENGGEDGAAAQTSETAKGRTTQKKKYAFISALLFAVNLLLIGPITLMVQNQRKYTLGMIPAITVAAYSVYKITLAAVNYKKTRKTESDVRRLRNAFRLIDALVSVLTLQNTLLIATGGAGEEDMRVLSMVSSAAIYALVAAISFVTFFRTVKKRR